MVEIYDGLNETDELTNSERDILLCKKEKDAIIKLKPLSQLPPNDNLNPNRVDIVGKEIKKLLDKQLTKE